jgi:hypothetical protein
MHVKNSDANWYKPGPCQWLKKHYIYAESNYNPVVKSHILG